MTKELDSELAAVKAYKGKGETSLYPQNQTNFLLVHLSHLTSIIIMVAAMDHTQYADATKDFKFATKDFKFATNNNCWALFNEAGGYGFTGQYSKWKSDLKAE
ncbi:hypothetical protein AX16_007801 [Volvariella volvacea WC 439]|nr:hypothetical protein AX16_007801 [Volvariella volvacea WC 439]